MRACRGVLLLVDGQTPIGGVTGVLRYYENFLLQMLISV